MMTRHLAVTDPATYAAAYNRGWRTSHRGGGLVAADLRGESDAWYDGYLDYAAGRDKWHLRDCPDHGNHATGCGVA